jgi:hypothetical protein
MRAMRRWTPLLASLPLAACSSSRSTENPATPDAAPTGQTPGSDASLPGADAADENADAGAGGDAPANEPDGAPASLTGDGGMYELAQGDLSIAIDPRTGGRVTSLRLGTDEWLTGPDANAMNYGSTFWTSPQNDWDWPPPAEIDTDPYAVTVNGNQLLLQGKKNAALGVAVTKQFSIDPGSGAIVIDYRIENQGSSARSFAPWEVTRVMPAGLFAFPSAAAGYSADSGAMLPAQQIAGATWYSYAAATLPDSIKFFGDPSGGWLAQVRGDAVFVKKFSFTGTGSAAPGESQVEIFFSGDHAYVELETQGTDQSIAAGSSLEWTSRWFLRKLPAGLDATQGSAALVSFVNGL